jgi:hypothetical protein
LVFFIRSFFEILFFLSWSHITGNGFIKLARVDSGFLLRHNIFWIYFFGFHLWHYVIKPWTLQFFSLSFLRVVSISYLESHFSKFNLGFLGLSSPKYFFLALENVHATYLVITFILKDLGYSPAVKKIPFSKFFFQFNLCIT